MYQTIKKQPAGMKTICVNPCFLFLGLTLKRCELKHIGYSVSHATSLDGVMHSIADGKVRPHKLANAQRKYLRAVEAWEWLFKRYEDTNLEIIDYPPKLAAEEALKLSKTRIEFEEAGLKLYEAEKEMEAAR